ncbi:MAG: PAS domain S-box protein [Chitinispirillaceae bacterium]|nr:PAS domain S-box protein [Chitinispirillaceae bacterium]
MARPHFPSLLPVSASSVGVTAIAAVFFIAVLDLVGWAGGFTLLKGINAQFTPMKVITAICFLLSAASLACLHNDKPVSWKQRLSLAFGAAGGSIGFFIATTYGFEIATGHQWSWVNNPVHHLFLAPSSRMAVITAILFSLFGVVLLLLGTGNRRAAGAGHAVLLPVSMMSYLVVIGYLFNIRELYTWRNVSVAINTCIAFCCLCVAAFCVRPDTWFMHVFTSEGTGADMSRRLLPFLLLLPLAIGWLRLHGERYGIFGSEVGVAVMAVIFTLFFILLLWLNARAVNRTDLLRRKAEETLRENEKMLNRAQEIAQLGSWELDLVNSRLYWSDEVYRIFGFVPREFEATYEAFLDAVHPEDRAAVDTAYGNSVREGRDTYEIEHRIVRKYTGEIRIVHEKCEHLRDENGRIIRSTGMVHDVTDHKEAEERLKKAKNELELRVRERTADLQKTMETLETERRRFNDVLNMLPVYVILLTPDHRIPFANRFFRERFGESGDRRCFEYLFGRKEPCEICKKYVVLATMTPREWEWTGPDGRHYQVFDFPFSDIDGAPLILEMGIDITARKRAEEAVNQLAAIVESSDDAIAGKTLEGTITSWNRAAERIYGYRADEVIGRSSSLLVPPDRPDEIPEILEKIRRGVRVAFYETTRIRKDGRCIAASIAVSPINDSTGKVIGASTITRDITERKRVEAELREANEMKLLGQLTSGVAHEVRNPLNGILAIMGALSKELSDNGRFTSYMQHMRNQVTRLTVLMEELLVLGRPLREENLNEISMVTLVEKTCATWLQTLQPSKPSVRFIKPEDRETCLIRADGTSMAQVIINFLENAFHHSPAGEEIVCAVFERPPDHVIFSVKDRGAGISEEILPKIFEPFFTTRKGGTGLGLSIVRRIIDNHHGTVIVCNNTDGPGATFEVTLPLHVG